MVGIYRRFHVLVGAVLEARGLAKDEHIENRKVYYRLPDDIRPREPAEDYLRTALHIANAAATLAVQGCGVPPTSVGKVVLKTPTLRMGGEVGPFIFDHTGPSIALDIPQDAGAR